MTDLGTLSYIMVISLTRTTSSLFLHQRKYTEEIIRKANMSNCKPAATPVDTNGKLGSGGAPVADQHCTAASQGPCNTSLLRDRTSCMLCSSVVCTCMTLVKLI